MIIKVSLACDHMQVDDDITKSVCVCNEERCNKLDFEWPQESGEISVVQSTEFGLRFQSSDFADHIAGKGFWFSTNNYKIDVDLGSRHQAILGWGGGFSDAVGINLSKLSTNLTNKLLASYYGKHGLQYNYGRVPMGGSDFSTRAYSYDDSVEPDYNLTRWSLTAEDTLFKIPYIQRAIQATRATGLELRLIASPWSPPKWMKTNKNFVRGKLIDKDTIYRSYTEYLMKFYDAYEKYGVTFWGATVQNEPLSSNLPTYSSNSVQFGNNQMTKFIGQYLGPALVARGYTKDNFKLMVGDDSLGFINLQVPKILQDERVQKYVSGLAFHWYLGGMISPYETLEKVYESTKDKIEFIIMTEACTGLNPLEKKVDLGSWKRGENYASNIIEDLNRNTNAWIDWNLALDLVGGPSWVGNNVDSPIIINSKKGEFYRQPMYYALAHFSRFFRPGSIRIGSKVKSLGLLDSVNDLLSVSVLNEETGHLIVNILNKSGFKKRVDITIEGLATLKPAEKLPTLNVPGKSVNTIVIKL